MVSFAIFASRDISCRLFIIISDSLAYSMQGNIVLQLLIWESELLQQSKNVKKRLVLAIQELYYHTILQIIEFFIFTIVLV